MSGVMETRDRWLVADNPVSFDSDYMVFVSPPAAEISKATSPIKPFTQAVNIIFYLYPGYHDSIDVAPGDCDGGGVCRQSGGHGHHHPEDWAGGG